MKNKEELPMNSDRGNLFRQERTDPARNDQPALDASSVDALMELIVEPSNLDGCPFTLVTRAVVFGCATGNSGDIRVLRFVD